MSPSSKAKLDDLPSEVLLRIFSFLSIHSLHSVSLTNSTLNHLARFPQLYSTLDISRCTLTKATLPLSMTRSLVLCKRFVVKSPDSISRWAFASILDCLKHSTVLESIRLTGVTHSAEELGEFFEQCRGKEGLKEVVLSRCSVPSEAILKLLSNHGGGLSKLSLKFSEVEDVVLDKIIEMSTYPALSTESPSTSPTSLKTTRSSSCPSTSTVSGPLTAKSASEGDEPEERELPRPFLDRARGRNNLRELCLAGCFNITEDGLSRLFASRPAVCNIQKIDLRWNDEISTSWFRNPDMFPNLRELDLRGCGGITGQDVRDLRRQWGSRLLLRETALDDESFLKAGWKGCFDACESNKWTSTRLCPV
ncbi:hypothetical protein BJ508DRAFT_357188 [Ascobolus immersus RN42]|uniref:F-box domain-containing protein n=1 Tax=Ascobolus immersus RN42 TaxID=1160509 RepID=A0A3N4IN49_ASCIM|nr:hypothetical protein BJ508DRAFT_357188 [Ascobolus immersus RN42]